jgi:hypothetical protein
VNLGSLFTSIGEAGSQAADAKLKADQFKLDQLFNQLGLKQAGTNLAESQERLKRLQAAPQSPEEEFQRKISALKSVLPNASDNDIREMIGLAPTPVPPKPQNITNLTEYWIKNNPNGTPDQLRDFLVKQHTMEQKATTPKLSKTNTYDPSGHLREAWVDPTTGEVSAWGPLTPEREAFHYWTDEAGQIHAQAMPTMRHIAPGEIRMTEQAKKQWDEQLHGKDSYATKLTTPTKKASGVSPEASKPGGGTVIGDTTPKYAPDLKDALKDSRSSYTRPRRRTPSTEERKGNLQSFLMPCGLRSRVPGA